MINNEPPADFGEIPGEKPLNGISENVCNLSYLKEMMGGKKHLIKEIMEIFLTQVPEELDSINNAVIIKNYAVIKSISHTMKSSVSVMGVSLLTPVLREMEDLAAEAVAIEKIMELNLKLNLICQKAIEEIKEEIHHYI